jgi:hypothetical protein
MSSQVRKNVTNPHNNLFHHGHIKLLVLAELEKQGQTWDQFIYQFSNPHLTIKTGKKTLGLRTIYPSKPRSLRIPNPLTQTISLPEQKCKKLVETPTSSSGKNTKSKDQRKHIANIQIPSISLDPTPKKIQEVIQKDFPTVPTNRKGSNWFDRGPFQKNTQSTRGKPYAKSLTTPDPIQVSFNLESPHKILREVSADELKPQMKTQSEPTSPHQPPITPTSPMPTPDPKNDRHSTSFKGSKPSFEISDPAPAMEKSQQENFHLLQQLEDMKTLDTHLHHDNAFLQAKVSSLQRLVDEMTKSNRSLGAQLKKHKRHKTKYSQQEGESYKANPPQQS